MGVRLVDTGDRLGGILSTHIASIMYAHHHSIPIERDVTRYDDSIFMKALCDWIAVHNRTAVEKESAPVSQHEWYRLMVHTLATVKADFVSYFYAHLRESVCASLSRYALERDYRVPFNARRTILVHLRRNDVQSLPDYDGRVCNNAYANLINSERYDECMDMMCENRQSPISIAKLGVVIKTANAAFPGYEVILLTSPGETLHLPYRVISNQDESLDLYLLCKSDVVILSRSTFSLMSLLFGDSKHVYAPLWCHSACMGLTTKFDNSRSVPRKMIYYS